MSSWTALSIARLSASVTITQTQDGAILFDREQGLLLNINRDAAATWNKLREHLTIGDVARYFALQSNVSYEGALTGVIGFVELLHTHRLLDMFDQEVPTIRAKWWKAALIRIWGRVIAHSRRARTNE